MTVFGNIHFSRKESAKSEIRINKENKEKKEVFGIFHNKRKIVHLNRETTMILGKVHF